MIFYLQIAKTSIYLQGLIFTNLKIKREIDMATYTTHQDISTAVTFTDTDLFTGIQTTGDGAALLITSAAGNVTVTGSTFSSNTAGAGKFGGAIRNYAVLTINSSSVKPLFTGNTAETGGAIFNDNGCSLSVTDAVFHGNIANNNSAGWGGGAIYSDIKGSNPAAFNVYGSTFSANSAANANGRGGAIDAWGINNFSTNSLFTGNYAGEWGGAVDYYERYIDDGSTFSNNVANKGGAVANNSSYASGGASGTFSKSQFNANTATLGGAASFDKGTFLFSSASFASNIATTGGAIANNGAIGTVSNSNFANNSAGMGGAIFNANTITVSDSTFTANVATGDTAGAIYNADNALATIQNSVFDANSSSRYGGSIVNSGSLTVSNSNFTGSFVAGSAGALWNVGGTAVITDTNFTGSSATVYGGAIGNRASLTLTGATFTGNAASYTGGAIMNENNGSTIVINNSLFQNNVAGDHYGGGAIYSDSRVDNGLNISGSTFTANSATHSSGRGGALDVWGGNYSTNSLFERNQAYSGGAVSVYGTYADNGSTFTNNLATNGGAIGYFSNAPVTTVTRSLLQANTASTDGGAIWTNGNGVLTVDGATFTANKAGDRGGALYVYGLVGATVTNATVVNNVATNGGAIYSGGGIYITGGIYDGNSAKRGGALYTTGVGSIQGATFSHNSIAAGGSYGGAIYAQGSLSISNTLFDANSASAGDRNGSLFGGGLFIDSTNVTVTGSTFAKNYSDNFYGGAGIFANVACTVSNNLFQENTGVAGAGFACIWVGPTVTGSTFTANSVSEYGGGYMKFASSNTATIASVLASTFTGNTAGIGGGALAGKNMLIDGSVFDRNIAANGGAYYMFPHEGWAIGTVSSSLFTANTASSNGGAVYLASSSSTDTLTVSGSTFTDNVAGNYGGAICLASGSPHTLTVTGSTFSRNIAVNGGAIMADGWSAFRVNIQNARFDANTATDASWGGGAFYQYSNTSQYDISGSTFTNNMASYGGALASIRGVFNISNSLFEGNTASTLGGALTAHGESTNLSISGSTFTNNYSAGNGGAVAGYSVNGYTSIISLDNVTFTGNTAASQGGALYAVGGSTVTIKDTTFATESDTVVIGAGSDTTLKGSIVLNASITVDTVQADDLSLTFGTSADIGFGAITVASGATTGLSAVNFGGTGKVTFTTQDLSAVAITVTRATAGEYVISDGISALNTTVTVNGTATALTSGTGTSASSDGLLAQVVSFADSALNLSIYDTLYVGFGIQDATHFDTTADLQATYAGYSGTIIDASTVTKLGEVFYNDAWTSANLPASTTLADGSTVALAWGSNAFNNVAMAKGYLASDGILTFEDVVPTLAQTSGVATVRVHNAALTSATNNADSDKLILDGVTFTADRNQYSNNTDLELANINAPAKYIYTCNSRIAGDFNFAVRNSNISRFYLSNGTNSGVGGTVNFTISDSVTNRISLSASSDSGTSFNNINIVVNNTLVHNNENGTVNPELGDIRASGSSENVHVNGNASVTMNNSTAGFLYGSKGNKMHGDIYLAMNASTVANVIGKNARDGVDGSSYLTISGTTASVISESILNVDTIAIADSATLNLGSVTITDSNFTVTTAHNGAIAVLADAIVTLAGSVTIAKDFTLASNAAVAAADNAAVTLTATGTFSTNIATGTGNTLIIDNYAALSLTADVSGFATVTFAGDAAVDMNSSALENMAITVDTNNVWTNGVTTIATGISSLTGSTFTVNGLSATLGTAMTNGAVLDFASGELTLTVTSVEVGTGTSLDDALAATAVTSGVITFSSATDGTTCTFSGNTIGHDQVFQGNGATNTAIQAASASMVFANGNAVAMTDLAWSGIIYGGKLGSGSSATSLAFQDAAIGGNVFGGGRANTGSTIADGDVSLAIAGSTQAAGKAVYGGAYANGGTATAESVSLTLTDVNAGTNSVYGGGAVNNGGKLTVGPVSTKIEGGVYGAVYNGANIYTAGTGSAFGAGAMSLEINGGTFSGAVGNGSTPRAGASSTQGASTLAITDGLFSGPVYGGAASFGGDATVASTTVTISGGTFNGKVFGGNVGQTGAKAADTSLTGNANLTIDSTDANIYFNGSVYGGSMGTGNVGGDVTVTFKGDGDKLHFASGSFVSGASEYAYGTVADYVEGTKTLVFDGFVRSFSGNVQGPAFDTVTIKNGSNVRCLGAGQNQDFSFASTWNFELSNASAVMTTDENDGNHAKNNFWGDTINVTFADGAASVVAGTDWTVYTGRADTTAEWNNLKAVTIDGVAATGAMDGAYMAWTTDDYKVYLDGNYDIRLAKLA